MSRGNFLERGPYASPLQRPHVPHAIEVEVANLTPKTAFFVNVWPVANLDRKDCPSRTKLQMLTGPSRAHLKEHNYLPSHEIVKFYIVSMQATLLSSHQKRRLKWVSSRGGISGEIQGIGTATVRPIAPWKIPIDNIPTLGGEMKVSEKKLRPI